MKLVLAIGVQVALVFAVATSCSITHKSGDFSCTKTADCNTGRDCVDGFCVVSGTETIDAPVSTGDASHGDSGNGCPANCSSCDVTAHTCVIDCANGSNCTGPVVCPANYTCDVKCDTDNSCRNGVTCANTTSCKVECSGKGSCEDVTCGTSRCDVECTGVQSCKQGISCGASCACDVRCPGTQSCGTGALMCTPGCAIGATGTGCTSLPLTCHSCN
ncbi:MAG: hypothetical protein ABI591_33350 [Kofleriaceae bacterium]